MGTLTVEQWKAVVLLAFPNAEFEQNDDPEPGFTDDWIAFLQDGPSNMDDLLIGVWTLLDTGKIAWMVGNMAEQALSDSLLRMEK